MKTMPAKRVTPMADVKKGTECAHEQLSDRVLSASGAWFSQPPLPCSKDAPS